MDFSRLQKINQKCPFFRKEYTNLNNFCKKKKSWKWYFLPKSVNLQEFEKDCMKSNDFVLHSRRTFFRKINISIRSQFEFFFLSTKSVVFTNIKIGTVPEAPLQILNPYVIHSSLMKYFVNSIQINEIVIISTMLNEK